MPTHKMQRTQTMKVQTKKSIPLVCSWCKSIYKIDSWDIKEGEKSGVSHGICKECYEKMKNSNNDDSTN